MLCCFLSILETILILLDLSSLFDTVDYLILINCLEEWVVFRGSALEWFLLYITYKLFPILVGKTFSYVARLSCGVPQGSALGHLLFSIYMLPLGHVIWTITFIFTATQTRLSFMSLLALMIQIIKCFVLSLRH